MTLPSPDRARVLFSKGQNFFSAFFAELAIVRKDIGDDTVFARWCLDELYLTLPSMNRLSDVLTIVDAGKTKAEFAGVRVAEQERKRKEREQREQFIAAEQKRKQEEKAAAAAEKARQMELEKQREEAAKKHVRKVASKRKNNAGFKAKQREEKKAALTKLAASSGQNTGQKIVHLVAKPIAKNEDDLVRQIKAVIARRDSTRAGWIDASVELAGLLCEARAGYPADQKFSKWLDQHDIKISVHDRAALLNLGLDMQAMRVILEQTDRTSYELIWRDVKLQIANK